MRPKINIASQTLISVMFFSTKGKNLSHINITRSILTYKQCVVPWVNIFNYMWKRGADPRFFAEKVISIVSDFSAMILI